ncbi:MAG: thiol peroxidase [Phycisphaeraceae bacterium]
MSERSGAVTFKGNGVTLVGDEIKLDRPAPDFTATAVDMSAKKLSDYRGKVVILATMPSLDTPVCDIEAKRFNKDVGELGSDVVCLSLSMDLPFAQRRWCGAAGATNVTTLSDYKDHSAGKTLGLRIKELGLLARAVIIIDKQGVVRYIDLVKEVTKEPDYAAAIAKAKELAEA